MPDRLHMPFVYRANAYKAQAGVMFTKAFDQKQEQKRGV